MPLSICLLCSSFDIGGAETHVLTLAEALVKEGHRVTVVSAGGVYAERAKEGGFRHISMPLHQKRSFFTLLFGLLRLFRRERFHIIHAHARFPALLCRILRRKRTVVTAHWVFSTHFPLRALSFWGERCLAVSEDIAAYLSKEYGYPREQITVTVNGIDTERFRAAKEDSAAYHVCLCSRLDRDRSAAAFLLLDAAEALRDRFPFFVSIVGDGEDMAELTARAKGVNRAAGRELVRMLGASDRVEKVLGSADIFVGVSRAALEAMASECAVILAGNEGYLSVFSPRCASMAEQSNFCCRGGAAADATLLTQDLASLLALPKEALRAMGRANRAYVEEKYSARRMALDAIGAYEGVLKRKAILCGYYGFENVGDTLMHRSLTERLRGMGYQRIYTLSSKLFSLSSLYAVGEGYDFFLGGGNLLQSESSMRSLYFYTALMRFAAWRGGRVFMLSSGLGGFRATGEALASHCLTLCERIECRTEGDLSEAMRLGAKNAVLSHDAVLDLPLGIQKNGASRILLAFRSPKTHASRLSLSSFILRLGKLYGKERLTLFAMHPADARFVKRTARRLHISYAVGDADFFVSLLSECMAVYGNRLHAAVCAVRMGVPAFLLEEDEKSRRFAYDAREAAKSLSLPSPVKLFSLSADIPRGDGISRLGILRVCDKMRTDAEDVR